MSIDPVQQFGLELDESMVEIHTVEWAEAKRHSAAKLHFVTTISWLNESRSSVGFQVNTHPSMLKNLTVKWLSG